MDKAIINIIYTDSLESILVKGEEMEDISSIQDIPIPEWFSELDDRSGWGGLIEEIHKMLGDENVDLSFDFSGPYESSCIFKQCLKEHGFGEDALSPEEITKNNIEDAEKAEHRGFYKEALKHYTNAAEFGNSAEAQYKVAQYYYYDDINKRLDISFDEDVVNKAIDYYEQAAEQGYTKAGYRLFEIFSSGEKGVREDWTEAFKWLNEYSDQEDSEVQDNLGDCYYNGNGVEQNYEEAVKWYKKAAEQGNSYAQYSLGACYYNGYGTEKDYEKAVKWFRTAAEQDNSEAQCNLGDCYYYGDGIEQNYEEAVKWFRIAAEQGNSEAQYKLGFCYYNGYGTEKDYKEAVKWFR
ncbi:MAG: sel1 repeat family protein, partial [Lachnospiraceae bacterium]